jgi:hypothetical protein
MQKISKNEIIRIRSQYRKLGLVYGVIVGVVYSLSAWLYDAITLSRVNTSLPWLKFSIGLSFCVVVGAVAGLIVGSQDRGSVAVIIWLIAGMSFAWITGHLPFDVTSTVLKWLNPRFQGFEIYPLYHVSEMRTLIFMIIIGGVAGISGVFQLVILDAARSAPSKLGRLFILFIGIPFYILAGFLSDNQFNQIFRDPLLAVDKLVRFGIEHQGQEIDPQLALDMHYGSLRQVEDLIHQPRYLMLGDYDESSMLSTAVEITFGGTWARCTVINRQVTMCFRTRELYENGLICLANEEERCKPKPTEEAMQWVEANRTGLDEAPSVVIEDILGATLFLSVDTEDGKTFLCRFTGTQPMVFESCDPME